MAKDVYQLTVKDVMSREVVTVYPEDSLHEALELIVGNRTSALPVVNGLRQCIGMLSATDLIDLAHEFNDEMHNLGRPNETRQKWLAERLAESLGSERVSEQMSYNVATIKPEATLAEAASLMLKSHVHRLPVIDSKDRLLGIVSTMDILGAFADGARKVRMKK